MDKTLEKDFKEKEDFESFLRTIYTIRQSGNYSIFKNISESFLRPVNEISKIKSSAYKIKNKKNKNAFCLFPNCTEKAIASHSIQKSLLKDIADSNSFLTRLYLDADFAPNGSIEVKVDTKFSMNKASTFYGFCNKHDTRIFSPIENTVIDKNNSNQMFLLLYRAVSREYSEVKHSYGCICSLIKDQSSINIDENLTMFLIIEAYRKCCELHWIDNIKQIMDCSLSLGSCKMPFNVEYIELPYIPVYVNTFFALQGAIEDISYEGIDISKEPPFYSALISVPKKTMKLGFYYFYLDEQKNKLAPVIRNLRTSDSKKQENFISDMILRNSDNFYLSSEYWNQLTEEKKESIKFFFYKTVFDRVYDLSNTINLWEL